MMRQIRTCACSLIGLGILLLVSSNAMADTYIVNAGESIQTAIDGALASDVILIGDGVFNQNVNVNKAVTLVSMNGAGATTIQGSAVQATALGGGNLGTLCLSVDGIAIGTGASDGLTIIGYDWAAPGLEHAAIYIKNSVNGNISIIGNSLVADGEAALLAEYGCITGGNVDVAFNTFSGQTYVGTTVGGDSSVQWTTPNVPRPMVYFGGNNIGVSFHDNVLSGSVGAIIEGTSESYYNTGATIDCNGATDLATGAQIINNIITIPSWAALRARGGFSTVTDNDFDTSVSGEFVGAYYQNYETGVFANNQRYMVAGMTIQQAHDAAFPGDVVNIPAGLFEEQVHITTSNLIFTGEGAGDNPALDTIILSPVSLAWFYTTSGDNKPIVGLDGVTDVTVRNLRVDGAGRGNTNVRFQGVGFWNSSGALTNVDVVNVIDTPFSGAQHGVGVYAYNNTGGPYTVNLTGVNVSDFQKGGIAMNGEGLTANVVDCVTTGFGPTDITAQNGIQFYGADGGTISGCSVTGNIFTGEGWAASGILLISAGHVGITDSNVTDGDPCVYCQDTSTTVDALVINNNHADSGNGFYTNIYSGITLAKAGDLSLEANPSPFGDYSGKADDGKGTATVIIANSTLTGQTTGYGISNSNSVATDLIDITVTNCAIKNWGWGVVMFGSGGEVAGHFSENGFIDNGGFLYADGGLTSIQEASGNYWGSNDPDYLIAAILGNVDYTPWLANGTEEMPGFTGDFSEVYVDDDGQSGTVGLIQEGIDLVSGSTVNVAAGMYPGNLILPTNLNLLGIDGAALTTIAGSGGTAVTVAGDNVKIDGFTVTNPTGFYAVSSTDNSNITVSNNIVTDIGTATTTGYVHAVVFVCSSEPVDNIVIEDNVLHAIHADEFSSASAIAVGWTTGDEDVTNLLIQRNTIYNIRSNTSAWNVGHGAYGILLSHSTTGAGQTINPQILNNTIDDLEGLWAHGIGLEGATPGAVVTGNMISNLVDHKSPSDAVAVMIEDNAGAGTLMINNNSFTNLAVGMVSTNTGEVVNALGNWWDSSSGPYNPDTNPLGSGNAVGPFINYDPWMGVGDLTVSPSASGPLMCGQQVTLTFNLTTDLYTPDVFGYNAIVRVDSDNEVLWGAITDAEPFTDDENQFMLFDQGDGSWVISGTTVGNPAHPIVDAGIYPLFSIVFTTDVEGLADITLDSFTLRDTANQPINASETGATILVDCTAPLAVTDINADPHHNKVVVNWAHPTPGDVDHYKVFSGLWHDGSHASVYPEYDDFAGNTTPARPANYAAILLNAAEWNPLGDKYALATDQVWIPADRGIYYYEVFAVDEAGNVSLPAAANDCATNYWLGDVDPDGDVDVNDISILGAAFGTSEASGTPPYNAFCDVGPTDDWSRVGLPVTDSMINFEDLMVFTMNFGVVSSSNKSGMIISSSADLSWVRYGEGTYALRLNDADGLKGVHLRATLPEGASATVTAGDLLDQQSEMTFLQNIGEGLDVNLAITGVDNGFSGQGDLFIVESSVELTMDDIVIDLRGSDNSRMEISLDSESGTLTPRVFGLNAAYPNPFNPMTKISFSLPETQDVRLNVYGIDGKLVTTLVNETRGAGLHEVIWNGQNDAGQVQASGLYFYRIEAGPYSQVRKMTLMK